MDIAELKQKSVAQLHEMAEDLNISNYSGLRKQDLIFRIEQNLLDSDIVLRGNTVSKQPGWRNSSYTVKNSIELKNAQRVVMDGNVIEYCWASGQTGHAIVLTPRNQDGNSPWSTVQQVQITNNVIQHVAGVLNILGTDYVHPSGNLSDVTFRNNLVLDLSGAIEPCLRVSRKRGLCQSLRDCEDDGCRNPKRPRARWEPAS